MRRIRRPAGVAGRHGCPSRRVGSFLRFCTLRKNGSDAARRRAGDQRRGGAVSAVGRHISDVGFPAGGGRGATLAWKRTPRCLHLHANRGSVLLRTEEAGRLPAVNILSRWYYSLRVGSATSSTYYLPRNSVLHSVHRTFMRCSVHASIAALGAATTPLYLPPPRSRLLRPHRHLSAAEHWTILTSTPRVAGYSQCASPASVLKIP